MSNVNTESWSHPTHTNPGRHTLLVVHAHPDDECSGTGGVFIRSAAAGHKTVLITCTNGEMGEAKDPRYPLNPRENLEDRKRLIELRKREQVEAVNLLNISHFYDFDYRDSGMAGWDQNKEPDAFMNLDLDEVAGRIARLIREHRPDVVVTYNENGRYGHPDHIMVHNATMAALDMAEDPSFDAESTEPWRVKKLYFTAWARSDMLRMWRILKLLRRKTPLDDPDIDLSKVGTADEDITTRLNICNVLTQKRKALYTYRSQMGVWGMNTSWWWMMGLAGRWFFGFESFVCVRSDVEIHPPEPDVFAGL